LNAFEKKINISNSLAVESLIYASTQRQIKKAVEMLGIKQGSSEVAVLIIAENTQAKKEGLSLVTEMVLGKHDDSVVELSTEKMVSIRSLFGISDLEFEAKLKKQGLEKEALTDLVIERMALLVTKS
jgi:tRNA threonylcarbamoyladenosine modification (KEOPS) complex Cgi121 subunit